MLTDSHCHLDSFDGQELDEIINQTFTVFFNDIVQLRGLSDEAVSEVITGKIFLGSEALNLSLIDGLSGVKEAEEYLDNPLE